MWSGGGRLVVETLARFFCIFMWANATGQAKRTPELKMPESQPNAEGINYMLSIFFVILERWINLKKTRIGRV